MKILTAAEMRAADAATTEEHGIPSVELMENAGAAVARFVLQELPDAERGGLRIVALCGKGNNGGDGFVAARILAEAGCDVAVLLLGHAAEVKGDAHKALERLSAAELAPVEAPDEAALAKPADCRIAGRRGPVSGRRAGHRLSAADARSGRGPGRMAGGAS